MVLTIGFWRLGLLAGLGLLVGSLFARIRLGLMRLIARLRLLTLIIVILTLLIRLCLTLILLALALLILLRLILMLGVLVLLVLLRLLLILLILLLLILLLLILVLLVVLFALLLLLQFFEFLLHEVAVVARVIVVGFELQRGFVRLDCLLPDGDGFLRIGSFRSSHLGGIGYCRGCNRWPAAT